MEFICAKCKQELEMSDDRIAVSTGDVKKYTYLLPSGRQLKVVVDSESDFMQTASSTPCFLLKMEDDPED